MRVLDSRFKCAVATFLAMLIFAASAHSQTDTLDELFAELAQPETANWQEVEDRIWTEWSKSGSPSMDLLLERGRAAMAEGDFKLAVEHLTALTDHAPDFAEGFNSRATAFYHLGEFGLAMQDIQTTLALNPRHFAALSGMGMILEELGHPEEALSAYRAAQAIHPHLANINSAVERLEDELDGSEV